MTLKPEYNEFAKCLHPGQARSTRTSEEGGFLGSLCSACFAVKQQGRHLCFAQLFSCARSPALGQLSAAQLHECCAKCTHNWHCSFVLELHRLLLHLVLLHADSNTCNLLPSYVELCICRRGLPSQLATNTSTKHKQNIHNTSTKSRKLEQHQQTKESIPAILPALRLTWAGQLHAKAIAHWRSAIIIIASAGMYLFAQLKFPALGFLRYRGSFQPHVCAIAVKAAFIGNNCAKQGIDSCDTLCSTPDLRRTPANSRALAICKQIAPSADLRR